mgnify:CR=1 FL=1
MAAAPEPCCALFIHHYWLDSILQLPANPASGLQISAFVIQGFLACLPLLLIQLIISLRSKTFGIPLAVSIALTIPAIIVASTPLGQFYPWTQPMLAMSPIDESPIESYFLFYCLLIGTFMLFLAFGLRSFSKQDTN